MFLSPLFLETLLGLGHGQGLIQKEDLYRNLVGKRVVVSHDLDSGECFRVGTKGLNELLSKAIKDYSTIESVGS